MPGATFRQGKWVDTDTGRALTPEESARAAANLHASTPDTPSTPAEMAQKFQPATLAQGLMRNVAPILSQTAGDEIGALGGGLVGGPIGAIAGAGIGAGLGGLASKHLPEKFGGTPEESNLHAFVLPSILGAAGRGIGEGLAAKSASNLAKSQAASLDEFNKASEATAGAFAKRFSEKLEPHLTQGDVGQVADLTSQQPYSRFPDSVLGRQQVFSSYDSVAGPIDRLRESFGAPIGQAYAQLKDGSKISEFEASDLADAAQEVNDQLISRAPKAAAVFAKIKSFRPSIPQIPGFDQMSVSDQLEAIDKADSAYVKAIDAARPSYDELRDLRQGVNESLRNASGGDRYALANLQQAIDQYLLPRLPKSFRADTSKYAQFMRNYPWKSIRDLNKAPTVNKISDWLFNTQADQAFEIVQNATPAERASYQRLYAHRLFRDVNTDATADDQMKVLAQNAKADGPLIRELYGNRTGGQIQKLITYPYWADKAQKIWNSPEVQRNWTKAFMDATSKAQTIDRQAAEDAFAELISSLSPEDRQQFMQGIRNVQKQIPSQIDPQTLPSAREGYQQQLITSAHEPYQFPRHLKSWVIPFMIGSLLTGHMFGVTYGIGAVGVGLGLATNKVAYRWAIDHGLADVMSGAAEAMAKGKYKESASLAFSALALAGGRAYHEHKRNAPK